MTRRVGEWLWHLRGVEPADDALDVLRAVAGDHVVVQPKVLDPDGSLHWFGGWPRYADVAAIVAAAPDRVLPLRAASFHGALIRADAAESCGPPLPWDHDGTEFTARLLRHGTGVLVPAATVTLTEPVRPHTLRHRLRIASSRDAWTARERFDRRFEALVSALAAARSS